MLEKIKYIAGSNKISMQNVISATGMTESGFYAMFRNDSIKVNILQKIAEVLNVPVSYFFEDSPAGIIQKNLNSTVQIGNNNVVTNEMVLKKEIESLEKQLNECKKDKEFLQKMIEKKS